jgi:hypothetical protein
MITKEVFTQSWLNSRSIELKKEYKSIDPILLEKVVKALHLLECLSNVGLPFIFKGGTSIILLLETARRFSIDIDIIVEKGIEINQALEQIVNQDDVFTRYEIDTRDNQTYLPVGHYKLYYYSIIDQRENAILLDVLFDENPYTGDKLTAFALNTTGIQYNKNKELEIIKQLFDIACLFDVFDNIHVVRQTFIKVAEKEISYRKLKDVTYVDVLDDIFNTAIVLAYRGSNEPKIFKHLENGVQKMRGYVLGRKAFIIEDAVGCAAKAAYLALLLKSSASDIEKFKPGINLNQYKTQDKKINTIVKINPEAYYYWYKSLELQRTISEVAVSTETEKNAD